MNKPPNSRVNLDKAIERHFGTDARFVEARSILANAIVGQFLPDGVAKGGSALKLRFGTHGFRATRDLDAARRGGALISFDPNLRPPLWADGAQARAQIEWGLGQCDILKLADNELENRYNPQIASRIIGTFRLVQFAGEDIRRR